MLTFIATLFVSAILLEVATLNGLAELDSKRTPVVKQKPVENDEPKQEVTKLGRPIEIVQIGK